MPGSVLRARVDPAHPLAWGMDDAGRRDVLGQPGVSSCREGDGAKGLTRVAWFDGKTPLRSGWAWGQEHLDGGIAIAEATVGKGRLVLCGPQILFRGQPHGTFKFLFNAIAGAQLANPER